MTKEQQRITESSNNLHLWSESLAHPQRDHKEKVQISLHADNVSVIRHAPLPYNRLEDVPKLSDHRCRSFFFHHVFLTSKFSAADDHTSVVCRDFSLHFWLFNATSSYLWCHPPPPPVCAPLTSHLRFFLRFDGPTFC